MCTFFLDEEQWRPTEAVICLLLIWLGGTWTRRYWSGIQMERCPTGQLGKQLATLGGVCQESLPSSCGCAGCKAARQRVGDFDASWIQLRSSVTDWVTQEPDISAHVN